MLEIEFTKMHGLHNSFVIMNDFSNYFTQSGNEKLASLAKIVCSYQKGIGADGLVIVKLPPSIEEDYDLEMLIFNSDGSEAKMCGNAIRCLAKYAVDEKITQKKKLIFKTKSGPISTQLLSNQKNSALVRVDMGVPTIKTPFSFNQTTYYPLSIGNQHAVQLVDNFNFPYQELAGNLQKQKEHFSQSVNVEFIVVDPKKNHITMRVVEAGVGETLACGTGACASAVIAINQKKINSNKVTVSLLGGDLEIIWQNQKNVLMTGLTTLVAKGTFYLEKNFF